MPIKAQSGRNQADSIARIGQEQSAQEIKESQAFPDIIPNVEILTTTYRTHINLIPRHFSRSEPEILCSSAGPAHGSVFALGIGSAFPETVGASI
ncbi:MAG TPA: hypothetical protein VMW38_20585 [Terriglobia bacterium]|nr:hypothetical protein [Terriglobia bacterium]